METVTTPQPQNQRVVLTVSWDAYVGIGDWLYEQPIRMTYFRGSMEIMTLSLGHARAQKALDRFVFTLAFELNIAIHSGGSTTCRSKKADCGLEPDECYWFKHEKQMRGKKEFDAESDPLPDLILEVETGPSVVRRLAVLAALGMPEVWRYDGKTVQVLLLSPDGTYQPAAVSKVLPMAPIAEMTRFLELRHTMSDTHLNIQFRDWVREHLAAEAGAKKPRGRKKK